MSYRFVAAVVSLMLALSLLAEHADARGIRVDGGAWDEIGEFDSDVSDVDIGFEFSFGGASGSVVDILAAGSVQIGDAIFSPFLDLTQSNLVIVIDQTNAFFDSAGIDQGFRVTWSVFDDAGALLNEYQIALWDLAGDMFAFEFNYDGITFGSDDSQIGFDDGAGMSFDLLAALDDLFAADLAFDDFSGIGDATSNFLPNSSDCPSDSALACNNFFWNEMDFGAGPDILPDIANGFFRFVDVNDDVGASQGRYLFIANGAQSVPEPTSLSLLGLGLLLLVVMRRRVAGT